MKRTIQDRNEQIRALRAQGKSNKTVAQRFRVSPGRVSQITRPPAKPFAGAVPAQPLTYGKLFQELGTTGLTRFGGSVHEEFLRELRGRKAIGIFKEMRENHPVVGAVFFAIEMALRQVRWKTEAASDAPADKFAAEFVESCLDDMTFTWQDTLSQVLTMLQYGYSPFELVYKIRRGHYSEPESRFDDGLVGWRKWMPLAQDTLAPGDEWLFDDNGGIQGLNQLAPPRYIKTPIPIEKMLLFRTSVAKNNPEGRSLLRGMYLAWYFSKNLMEIEGITAERMGAGLPVVYLGTDTSKSGSGSDLELAKQIVRDVRADEQSGIVIPHPKLTSDGKGMLFELVSPPSRGIVDFSETINRYDKRIAMAGLAQFIMLGMDQVGSYALSKDQSDLFVMALSAWAESVTQVINRYAIPRLVDLNPQLGITEPPQLTHTEVAVPNLAEIATYINTMVGAGVLTPDANLEARLREQAKLPPKMPTVQVSAPQPAPALPDANLLGDLGLPGQTPIPPDGMAEPFQVAGRRAYGGGRYETATNQYQTRIVRIYEDFYRATSERLARAPNAATRQAILDGALADLERDLKELGRTGLFEAMTMGAGDNPLTPGGYQRLANAVAENEENITTSLIPAIRAKGEAAINDPEMLAGGRAAIQGAFQTLNGRVGSYAGIYWQSIFAGLGDLLSTFEDADTRRVEWQLDPNAQHCDDCPRNAKIYDSFNAMELGVGLPGERVRCGANCRCVIRIETAPGSNRFERM